MTSEAGATVRIGAMTMAYSFQVVEDKLFEAEFFLKQLGTTSSIDPEARYYFSAFVSACRSVTFALQKSLKSVDGFDAWYKVAREQLKTDPLTPYFCEVRNQIVHTGVNPLNEVNTRHLRDLVSRQLSGDWSHVLVVSGQYGGSADELADAIAASADYFGSIVRVVFQCYEHFLTTVDARWYFTEQHFQTIGKTLGDALAELGFPAGWLEAVPGGDEAAAWRVLRAQQPPCQINELFEKYLGNHIPDPDGEFRPRQHPYGT